MLAKMNPLILTFDADGVQTLEKSGAHNFVPWSSYDGLREGKKVILLREIDTKHVRVVAKTVPAEAVEQLRSFIRSRLPEIRGGINAGKLTPDIAARGISLTRWKAVPA
jgi:hypothetical protein